MPKSRKPSKHEKRHYRIGSTRGPSIRRVTHHRTTHARRGRFGLFLRFQSASERHPRIYFQTASLPKTVSGRRTKVTVCLTSTIYSAPMGTSVSALTSRTPNRHLLQLRRTDRTHRKCKRSRNRCAGYLRRRSDFNWRRRSAAPSISAAAVKRMIRTSCRRIVFLPRAHAARAQRIERSSIWFTQHNSS